MYKINKNFELCVYRPLSRFLRGFRCGLLMPLMILLQFCRVVGADAGEPLRVAVSQSPLSLPFYVAEHQGYFSQEGLQLSIHNVIGGHRTMQQLLEGGADLATSSESVVMFNSFQRTDFRVLASFVSSDDDSKIVTRANSGINTPAGLVGKRIGTVMGGSSHYYVEMLLLMNGVDPKRVTLRNLQPEAMAEALRRGDVDAIAVWEPFAYKTLKSVPGARLLAGKGWYRMYFNLVVHQKHLGTRDGEIGKLLRALERAEKFINTQPQKAKGILLERLKLDNAFIDWMWPRYTYRLALDQALITTLEGEARWARQGGLVKGEKSPNYLDVIYSAPLETLNGKSVSIVR